MLSLATPTDVQACTRRCMIRYLQWFPADYEDYPEQWLRYTLTKLLRAEMVEVSRELVAMLDGDSGHLFIDKETDEVLLPHINPQYRQHNTVRFRMRGNNTYQKETPKKGLVDTLNTNLCLYIANVRDTIIKFCKWNNAILGAQTMKIFYTIP
jgi:hypothetical protein